MWYALGLTLGLIFLNFIIDKKTNGKGLEFCYLPECRVLKELRNSPIRPIEDSLKVIDILEKGEVIFSESAPRQKPCKKYTVKHQNKRYVFEKCDSYTTYYEL
ncbi:MAG: hypothetical protein RLZZ242_85 [Bacteroidota bacterium]|jgi:hypothetical protein